MNANQILRNYIKGWLTLLKSTFAIAGWQIMVLAPALFAWIMFKDSITEESRLGVYLILGGFVCLLIWAPLVAAALGPFGFENDEDWATRRKQNS